MFDGLVLLVIGIVLISSSKSWARGVSEANERWFGPGSAGTSDFVNRGIAWTVGTLFLLAGAAKLWAAIR